VVFGLYGCENGTWDDRGSIEEPADTTDETTEQPTDGSTEESTADVPNIVDAGLTPAETRSSSARAATESMQPTCRVLFVKDGPSMWSCSIDPEAPSRGVVQAR
jgi:hypothetical protein